MGKNSNTTTQSKTYNPAAMGAYQNVLSRAQGVANTPYQAYGGELTAGINPYQQQAFGSINQAAGFASPYIQEAAGYARGAAGPITGADISRYQDPYTQQVVDATQRQFETQNARAQSSLVGNAAAKGALGGDRVSVAQSTLAGEQARAQDPVIAGLYSQGYQGALAAAQAEAQRRAQAGGQLAGFGVSGAQAGLAGGQAMLGAGTLQQQTEQQRLQALYGQYQQAQAFPYQQAQWLAGITTGVGSQMGGTTTGEMTKPPPNPWATAAGIGLTAASFAARGGAIWPKDATEETTPHGFAAGGVPVMPWGGAQGWIPQAQIVPGKTEPELDKWPADKDADYSKYGQLGATVGKKAWDKWGSSDLPTTPQEFGAMGDFNLARGGAVWLPGEYAEGGPPVAGFGERYPQPDEQISRHDLGVPSWFSTDALGDAVPAGLKDSLPKAAEPRAPAEGWWGDYKKEDMVSPEVPLPRPRPAIAGMVPEEPMPVGLQPPPGRPPAGEEPDSPPPAYPAPVAFRPSGDGTPDAAPSRRSGLFGLGLDDATRAAIRTAGFAIMASRSPHLGVAIGEGGLTGMSAYAGAKGAEQAQREQDLTRAQEKRKFDLDVQKLDELSRHHRETLVQAQAKEKLEALKPIVINEEKDRYGTVIKKIMGVRDPASGGYRILNPDGSLGAVVQPGQVPPPAPAGTPNTTTAPRTAKSEEDEGIIPRNAQLVSAGPYDYSTNAPQMEKGFDVPEPQAVGDASSAAIKTAASRYLLDGTLPRIPFGNSSVAKAQRAYVMSIQNYANAMAQSRGISHDDLAELQRNAKGYIGFVTGQNGRTTVALGTAVQHLDTMRQLAKAWKEGQWGPDVPGFNALRSFVSRQFGSNAATDLQTASSIVGPEIIKAIGVAGAGTAAERLAQETFLSPRVSAEQMEGSIKTLEKLLGGQLKTKKGQAEAVGVDESRFRKLIGDRPYQVLMSAESDGAGGKGGSGADVPAKIVQPPGLPANSQYSPSRKMWRDPDGKMYDATGKPVAVQ